MHLRQYARHSAHHGLKTPTPPPKYIAPFRNNAPFVKYLMPQNLPHSYRMGQNENNGAFQENFIREFPLPDSSQTPLMGQYLKNGAKLNPRKCDRNNGAIREIMGQKSSICSSQECHSLGNNAPFWLKNVAKNGAIFRLAPFWK